MKHIKLFENFDINSIDEICEKLKIKNYTINQDGSIDVDGNVYLYNIQMYKLPLVFNKINGDFICNGDFISDDKSLTTLEGCPNYVSGSFTCVHNHLTDLKGSPRHIGGNFYCNDNKLTTLVGGPDYVGGNYGCEDNNLNTLIGLCEFNGNFEGDAIIQSIYDLINDWSLIETFYNFGIITDLDERVPKFNKKRFEKFMKINDLEIDKQELEYIYKFYIVI